MRYLGNKTDILPNIDYVIKENIKDNSEVFLDLFSGTASVSSFFKKRYTVFANDFLYFSYALTGSVINNNFPPKFNKLKEIGIQNPIYFLNNIEAKFNQSYFITKHYSPFEGNPRMYLSVQNAKKIDAIRQKINKWYAKSLIKNNEKLYLIASLIKATSRVSNTSGTYGAYLKKWDSRALKSIVLENLIIQDNGKENKAYNQDANLLVKYLNADICYLDPPYNGRQYSSNYHLLETISRYDYPEIKGVTGIRNYEPLYSSSYSKKSTVVNSFDELIKNIAAKHIVLSYSSDGLLTLKEIEQILKKHCLENTYKLYKYPYKKYQSKIKSKSTELFEYIFYIQKDTK